MNEIIEDRREWEREKHHSKKMKRGAREVRDEQRGRLREGEARERGKDLPKAALMLYEE